MIVGLGNPGRKYEQTRHNVGFEVAAKVAALISASPARTKFSGEVSEGFSGEAKLIVLCPHTYMNASGTSVRQATDFFNLSPDDVLVICDDLNLPTGRLRVRASGSAGGQKGLADIIRMLQTERFARLKIGIDRPPPQWDVSDYVLGKFAKTEQPVIEESLTRAAHAAIDWARLGTQAVMNQYNADPNQKQNKQGDTKPEKTASQNKNQIQNKPE